jgi:hypothetical protein
MAEEADSLVAVGLLVCTVRQITIPRLLTSNLFLSYRVDDSTGQSPGVPADDQVKLLDYRFDFSYIDTRTTSVDFSLHARSPWGKLFRIGSTTIAIPPEVCDEQPHSVDFAIPSDSGDFLVSVDFHFADPDRQYVEPELGTLVAPISPVLLYEEVASRNRAFFARETDRQDVYDSDSGVSSRLAALAKYPNPTDADIRRLETLLPPLEEQSTTCREQSRLFSRLMLGLLKPKLEFVTVDGRILSSDQAVDSPTPTYPHVALLLISQVDAIVHRRSRVTPAQFSAQMLDITNFLHHLANSPVLNERKLVTLLSLEFFVTACLDGHREAFAVAHKTMANALEFLITPLVEVFRRRFLASGFAPRALRREFQQLRRWFTVYGLPEAVAAVVESFLLAQLDLDIALKWMAADLTPELVAAAYLEITPSFKWPLLAALIQFAGDLPLIAAKKRKVAVYPKELPVQWMRDVLARRRVEARVVDAFFLKDVQRRPVQAAAVDIDEWAQCDFMELCHWKIPENLPRVD